MDCREMHNLHFLAHVRCDMWRERPDEGLMLFMWMRTELCKKKKLELYYIVIVQIMRIFHIHSLDTCAELLCVQSAISQFIILARIGVKCEE